MITNHSSSHWPRVSCRFGLGRSPERTRSLSSEQPADLRMRANGGAGAIPGVVSGLVPGEGVVMGIHGFQGRQAACLRSRGAS
jgi:hypothetical protein